MTALASLRIFVDDLAAAAPFYRDTVGLTESWASDEVVVFGEQPMIVLERADAEAHAEGLVGRFVGAAFSTDDATALHALIVSSGGTVIGPPERQSWGGTLLHVKDPSDNTITFLQDDRKGDRLQ